MKSLIIDEETHKRLKILSAKCGRKIKELLAEALNLLFKKYGEKRDEL